MNLEDKRREYIWERIDEQGLPADPLELFSRWLEEALGSDHPDPTAMTLSTVERKGQPSGRMRA